jgi:hypothetical protein
MDSVKDKKNPITGFHQNRIFFINQKRKINLSFQIDLLMLEVHPYHPK